METLNITKPVVQSTAPLSSSSQLGLAILLIAFVFGFPGNLFVVWTVLFRVQQRSVTCLLVLNLAAADAFVLLSAPLFIRYIAGGKAWEFGSGMCKTVHYLCSVNMYVSIYLICLMSIDRWLAVTKPFLSQRLRKKKVLYIVMLGIWALAFILATPMPFYRSNLQLNKNVSLFYCIPYHWGSTGHPVFQYMMETLFGFMIPFTFIILCYSCVVCRLRSAMFHGRVKGSLLILLIIITFAVFWLPYHTINIIQMTGMLNNNNKLVAVATSVRPNVTAFAFLSSSMNPLLYVFAGSSHIRRSGLGFMAKLFDATNSEQSTSRRRSTQTDSSALSRISLKSFRNGVGARKKSYGEEGKRVDPDCGEELNTLNM